MLRFGSLTMTKYEDWIGICGEGARVPSCSSLLHVSPPVCFSVYICLAKCESDGVCVCVHVHVHVRVYVSVRSAACVLLRAMNCYTYIHADKS